MQPDGVGAEALGALGVRGEEVAEVGGGELVVVGLKRRPRGPVAQGRDVGQVCCSSGRGARVRTLPAERARRYARAMPRPGSVRRRQAGVLILGAAEPELGSWLRAEGHAIRTASGAAEALAALDDEPAELVIVDREPGGLDAPAACVALREDARLGGAWLLAIAGSSRRRAAEPAYDVGADDYLHRPFTRTQLLARVRTGLRAVEQRTDDAVLRSMLATVPGAIYRSAWHAGQRLELITDEIERISGFPADNFVASARRTLVSIVHPDDRAMIATAVEGWDRRRRPDVLARVPDRARRRRDPLGARPRPARQGRGRADVDERRAVRHHRAARGRGRAAAARDRGRAHGAAARLARPHRRRGGRGPAQARARPARRRAAAARVDGARRPRRPPPARGRPGVGRPVPRPARRRPRRRDRPSCASSPAASTRPC